MICPICNEEVKHLYKHHTTPKSLGGRKTIRICKNCHEKIHKLFTLDKIKKLQKGLLSKEEEKEMADKFKNS